MLNSDIFKIKSLFLSSQPIRYYGKCNIASEQGCTYTDSKVGINHFRNQDARQRGFYNK